MAHEVDRAADVLQPGDDLLDLLLLGGGEAFRRGVSETGKCECEDIGACQVGTDLVPDVVSVRDAMNEYGRHRISPVDW
ncbi:hypothetical protein [Streptomyces sp. NPDC097610]|uniref:hypothetical protein n=1 Tax=Streptomyces sp. NPDC097610 TaxID=3157227 RepID=UPI003328169F